MSKPLLYFDELYMLLSLWIQNHYLKTWNASFTEQFYGIKRSNLNSLSKAASLLSLVMFPYVKDKYSMENIRYFSLFASLLKGISFLFQLSFLIKKSKYFSLFQYLTGLEYSRITEDQFIPSFEKEISIQRGIMTRISDSILKGFQYALPMTVFFIQFMDWWSSSSFSSRNLLGSIPEAPSLLAVHRNGIDLPTDLTICPICRKKRKNDACIPSGYVFCYRCIHKYISSFQQCPISHSKTEISQIRKIYN